MATVRPNARLQVGSAPWIADEQLSALQIAESEAEEFGFSARNEVEWLNEHMAEIFNENNINVADIFKTPGKLRGKTPRTARKANPLESRPPLSDVFSATPRGAPSPFKQQQSFKPPTATFQVAEDVPSQEDTRSQTTVASVASPIQRKPVATNHFDSGYFGSQAVTSTQPDDVFTQPTQVNTPPAEAVPEPEEVEAPNHESDTSFDTAKEEQTHNLPGEMEVKDANMKTSNELNTAPKPVLESPLQSRSQQASSPRKRSPQRSPERPAATLRSPPQVAQQHIEELPTAVEDEPMEDVQSPTSDGSSPIRPIVRKSSLNFASLPAREPITTKKSIGARVSRPSQLEQTRTSYYGRTTGGKSLGHVRQEDHHKDDGDMDVEIKDIDAPKDDTDSKMARLHNKTSTQRLQDQISKLGQLQSHRPASKSIAGNGLATSQSSQVAQLTAPTVPPQELRQQKSPLRKERPPPGAFPEDDEDSWIGAPSVPAGEASIFSPRPQIMKSHTTDVMEGIHGKDSIGGSEFDIPKRGEASPHRSPQRSPLREPLVPERTTSTLGHIKSVSTSVLRSPKKAGDSPGSKKGISVSNPTPSIHTVNETESTTPPKSPSRSYRGSPIKAAKDKFSSLLKGGRGLFASSAAASAEGKSALSPQPANRSNVHPTPSFEDILSQSRGDDPLYPTLSNSTFSHQQPQKSPRSPFKNSARKTRASTEREERKKEDQAREAREAKEAKDAQKKVDQLEKVRQKVKEDAHVYHLEQERVAAMQKEVRARKEQEEQAKKSQADLPRATRSSPRKTKAQLEAEGIAAANVTNNDVEMTDASAMPPPAIPRPKSQIGRPGPKRPVKPSKEPLNKAKPPTVIRVDTGSQRGHQYHPSTSTLSASLHDSLSTTGSQNTLKKKVSTSSIQSKASTNSFKSAASKALDAAARKKEQDELAAQKKREAKMEIERQRAAIKEEERRKEEHQRRQEAERQRELQRERERATAAADAKKAASRQAMEKRRQEVERAKQTAAPPPAVRPQPSGDLRQAMHKDKELPPVPQPKTSRMESTIHRPQEDFGRSVNGGINATKVPPKRPLQQDDEHSRPPMQRNGPSFHNEPQSKRRRTSEKFDDDDEDMEDRPRMTAPPIRQSSSRQKDAPTKSLFPNGYANAPSNNNLQRSTLISQHNLNQSKPAHPMDMAQVSKGPIPFATSSSQGNSQPHKTPARPGTSMQVGKSAGKSTAKASPKYQNGENIELPEINTDSEDSDSDAEPKKAFPVSDWAASPIIRDQLARQEAMDPSKIFGNPGPLNMEEVFSKSKDRFGKFRARTSSANWSGVDRLTEDEIRKDLQARDKLRRQGGWTYDSMV